MSAVRVIRRKVRMALPSVFFLAVIGYFQWNATRGDLGLHSYRERLRLLSEATASETVAQQDLTAWQQRVSSLRDKGLDPDTLDERARAMLNLADPSDIVVPYDHR